MFGTLFNAVSPTPGTSPDIEKAFGKYLLNDCSIEVFDCELLNSRVSSVGNIWDPEACPFPVHSGSSLLSKECPLTVGQLQRPGPLWVADGEEGCRPQRRDTKPAATGDACGCPHTPVPALLEPHRRVSRASQKSTAQIPSSRW